ncbi:MAG: S-layer homology domain-containing protein [Bacillota bacterium]
MRPSNLITRAEYAAVVVRMLDGWRMAGALSHVGPEFTDDVPAWAWSSVNAAHYLGVITGYPDGTRLPTGTAAMSSSCGPKGVLWRTNIPDDQSGASGHSCQGPL